MPRAGLQTLFTDDDRHGLAYLKDYRVGQVTTHGHDRPIPALLPSWKEFAGTMHRDNVPIPPGGKWCFDEIEGPMSGSRSISMMRLSRRWMLRWATFSGSVLASISISPPAT